MEQSTQQTLFKIKARERLRPSSFPNCSAIGSFCGPCPFYSHFNFSNMQNKKKEKNGKCVERTATIQLPISNDYGVPILSDFFAEVQRRFDVEMNIKNNLYAFIFEKGLGDELLSYSSKCDMSSPGGHLRAISGLFFGSQPELLN